MLQKTRKESFQMQGLILAGGFVQHPIMAGVHLVKKLNRATPMTLLKIACGFYARYARFRHRRAPETLACISEFVQNRTIESDRNGRTQVDGAYVVGWATRPDKIQAIISAGDGAAAALDILSKEAGKDLHDFDSVD